MLKQPQLNQAEQARVVWRLILADNQTMDDLKKPDFWANIASRFTAHDRIEVMSEDGNEYAELIVRQASRLFIKVAFLSKHKFIEDESTKEGDLSIKWRGKGKWSVMQDETVLEGGFELKEDAIKAKDKYAISKAA